MPINIFANAEAPSRSSNSDIVGRFRAGRQLQGRPMSLDTFRITTSDPDVADQAAELLGAVEGPQEWDTKTDEVFEVITEAESVDIILQGEYAISSEMVLWGRKGKVRQCDGATQVNGKPCECPQEYGERIEAAKEGTGCEPSISLLFSLADAPDLGRFRFQSGSWTLANMVAEWEEAFAATGHSATATLTLQERTRKATGTTYRIAVLSNIQPLESEES